MREREATIGLSADVMLVNEVEGKLKGGEKMPDEKDYMNKTYCMDCLNKHLSRAEHHGEDFVTGTKDSPELRVKAQEMVDKIREMRKAVDEMRINEAAKQRLNRTI